MCRVVIAVSRIVVSLNYGEELAEFKRIERKLVHQIVIVEQIKSHVQQWVTCSQLPIGDKLVTRLGVKIMQVTHYANDNTLS